ncbi:MAG TPA: hypothetical protein VM425_20080 [Myxococcota bacterium]|nr:hypothetical protein [Myxococcota bacterium]
MIWITIGVMFCGGVLAASNLIIAKKPDAKELIDKLVPYQGWIGIVMFLWGIWDTIHVLTTGWFAVVSVIPVSAIVILVAVLVEVVLGFLLGFGLISKYALSKNEQALAKGQEIRGKLAKFQGPLGLIAIFVSIYILLWNLIHWGF